MKDRIEGNGTVALQNFIRSFVKDDSSCVILQSIQTREDLELTDGRLLVSHNPKLIANLTTDGKLGVFLNTSGGEGTEGTDSTRNDVVLRKIEIQGLLEGGGDSEIKISNAVWCKSIIREDSLREFEVAPTLVLLERPTKYGGGCRHCFRHSGSESLTIVQFSGICSFESEEHDVVELSVNTDPEGEVNFNRPISIDFKASKTPPHRPQTRAKIRYCRIPVENVFRCFFNRRVEFSEDHKGCKDCFSFSNIQIFADSSMESGFVVIMANLVFLSLDLSEGQSLVLNRRFLLQRVTDPPIRFSGFAVQDGWLASVSLDALEELLIWNYCQGIAFRRFKLGKDRFGFSASSGGNTDVLATLSFGRDLSKLFLVLTDCSGGSDRLPNRVWVFVVDLNVMFSQVLCSYCILKSLIDGKAGSEARIPDPGTELKGRLQISSGSIPHVQLNDEYSPLTAYPEAFHLAGEDEALEQIMSFLPEESGEYLDSAGLNKSLALRQDLTRHECGWPLLFNRSWFFGDLSCNYAMNRIILSAIERIIASSNPRDPIEHFEELSNKTYLEVMFAPLKKVLEGAPELVFSESEGSRQKSSNCSVLTQSEESGPRLGGRLFMSRSSFIRGQAVPVFLEEELVSKGDSRNELCFTDIIVSSDTIFIQLSVRGLLKKHMSFFISQEDGQLVVDELGFEHEYSMMIMSFSRVIDWHYFTLRDTESGKSYIGLFSKTFGLLGLIYSTLRYQDVDNLHKICRYNKVDPCIIPLIQLEMGFKHEELKLISLSLENTPTVLNIEIVKLAHNMLRDTSLHLSLGFKRESSKLLLKFCLDKIKFYSDPSSTTSVEETKQKDSRVDELLQEISYYLSIFRRYLKTTTAGLPSSSKKTKDEKQLEDLNDDDDAEKKTTYEEGGRNNLDNGGDLSDTFVRDQIILGHYSSLVDWYLKGSRDKNPQTFRLRVLHEIYKLICTLSTNSLTLSIHMLRQTGENTTRYLKNILYYTSRREIRRRLINHLKHFRALDDDDISLIQFSNELESHYPNNCYTVERNRIWTSLLTYSIPCSIPEDPETQESKDERPASSGPCMDDYYLYGDEDQTSHVNNPIFSAMTYPFGGLQALKSGLRLNEELAPQYIENLKRLREVGSISAKRSSSNKENIQVNNRDSLYSSFSSEAIAAWEKLRCCEIEDYDLEPNSLCSQGGPKGHDAENEKGSSSSTNTVISSIPEQEGNDFVRLNNGRLISIKNSSCKLCLDLNEDEELEIEEELLSYESEHGQVFVSGRGHLGGGFSLSPSQDEQETLSQSAISASMEKIQPGSILLGDHNSKRGDLTWLKLQRKRRETMTSSFGSTGYLSHSLHFLGKWSFDVSIRVVIEKTHLQICFVWNRMLRGVQAPPPRKEALVYSLLSLMIKKSSRQLSTDPNLGIDLDVAKQITSSIYIAVFGFMFSHFEWRNIPASISYLDSTLFLLLKHFGVQDSYKYDLVNEIISLNFRHSPRFIVEIFLNSLDSSGIIPIHHLKTDLLQEKICHIEVDRYKNIKYIIDKCISCGDSGVYLFRHYLTRSKNFTSKESLHTFLSVIEGLDQSNGGEEGETSLSRVDYTDYLNVIYIYLDRKQDIVLLSLKQTFESLKSSLEEDVYRSLLEEEEGSRNETGSQKQGLDEKGARRRRSPGFMLGVLVRYFNKHYLDKERTKLGQKEPSGFLGKDERINISPYYVISILFSLDIPRRDVYSQDFCRFLGRFFPSMLKVFRESFLDDQEGTSKAEIGGRKMLGKGSEDSQPPPPFSIARIIKMTDKGSEPLVELMELYPRLRENSNSTDEFLELFHENLNRVTGTGRTESDKSSERLEDRLSLPVIHYVAMGRPFFAFNLVCMRHAQFHNGLDYKQFSGEFLRFPDLTEGEKVEIYQSVYTLAIRNFTRDKVVCSSVIFLSMLELPTELLCTDIRVARCIYVHQIHKKDGSDASKVNYETQEMDIRTDSQNSERIREIWSLFLKFGPPKISSYLESSDCDAHKEFQDNQKYSSSLFSVLKMLEEAAWASGDIISGGQSHECDANEIGEEDGSVSDNVDLLPHTPIWHLVATFCRIHGLPRSLTLLHELARRGEWAAFLQECDSQKCPLETVGNIINEYISENPVLKLHLKIALNIANEERDENGYLCESSRESGYIIELVKWSTLFHSLREEGRGREFGLSKEERILEFYRWSVGQVFREIIQEMSVSRVFLYYSLFEEHYFDLVKHFPAFKDGLKKLINASINSYLLIELIHSLCYVSIRDGVDVFQDDETRGSIFNFGSIQGFESGDGRSASETETLHRLVEQFVSVVFQVNGELLKPDKRQDEQAGGAGGGDSRSGSDDEDSDSDDMLTESRRTLLLERFVRGTKDTISRMNELKLEISSDSLDMLFETGWGDKSSPEDGDSVSGEIGRRGGALMYRDETTVMLWRLLSNLGENGLLSRASGLFYGEDTQITRIFSSIESLYSYDVEKAMEDLDRILICPSEEEGQLERDRLVMQGFLPPRDLVRSYFEQEFLRLYGRMTVEDHRVLWRSIREMSWENRYPREETLFFEIENHGYRMHILDLLYLNMEDYQVTHDQLERWLSVSEKMLLRDFYDQKRYGLLLRYLEESSTCRELLNDLEVLSWLEGSFLSEVATELDIISTNAHFKSSSSLRGELIRSYLWPELKRLSALIRSISMDLAPLFLVKISVYCWYLIEKLERWLSAFDQVFLVSISIHFLLETLGILDSERRDEDRTVHGGKDVLLEYVPESFDREYVRDCIRYAGYKLFLLFVSNFSLEKLRQTRIKMVLESLTRLIYLEAESGTDGFRCDSDYFDSVEEVFLASRGGSVIFTPSGYFNFKNVTTEVPFSIQIPARILLNDHPVDAKNVHSSVKNIVNFMFDISLAFGVGLRFVPNVRNKLEGSRQRFERRFRAFTQRLFDSYSSSVGLSSSSSQSLDAKTDSKTVPQSSADKPLVNLSRSIQAWDSVTDYLVEAYYISSIFTRVILIWLSLSRAGRLGPGTWEEPGSDRTSGRPDFNELLARLIRGAGTFSDPDSFLSGGGEDGHILWRNFILVSSQDEEPSISNVTYKMRLQSVLTLLQFAGQISSVSESWRRFSSYYVSSIRELVCEIIQDSGLSEDQMGGGLSGLDHFEEPALFRISRFVLGVFTSSRAVPLFKMILELSIEFEYGGEEDSGSCVQPLPPVRFRTIQKCIKVILVDNAYIEKEQVDSMLLELVKYVIQRFHSKPCITFLLNQVCQLVMDPGSAIEALTVEAEESEASDGGWTSRARRESIYLHLARYYLVMTGLHDEHSRSLVEDAVSKVDELLTEHSRHEFDPVLFANILLEIPEVSSLNSLSSAKINQVLKSLEVDDTQDGGATLKNSSSCILPGNWVRVYISQRVLSIFEERERGGGQEGAFGGRDMLDIGLISSRLKGPDLVAEFLVKKCLSKQWKVCTHFMYSKYGQYDLILALQALIHSCEMLKSTDHQQIFRVYQNLAGLFSLQLYFTSSYSSRRRRDPGPIPDCASKKIPDLPRRSNTISQETKRSIHERLACVIKEEEIDELLADLCRTDEEVVADTSPTERDECFKFETEKVRLFDLDLVDLFQVVSDPQICHCPSMVLIILNGYEAIYGPIVHSVWPRVLFVHSIVLPRPKFLHDYKAEFGALDENILLSMVRIYNNSSLDDSNYWNLEKINGLAFDSFIKSDNKVLGAVGSIGEDLGSLDSCLSTEFGLDQGQNQDTNIFDLALSWNERGMREKLSSMSKRAILENWTSLIQNFIDDIQLRISICKMVDEDGLSDLIFLNKKLYNDKSLYKFTLTRNS